MNKPILPIAAILALALLYFFVVRDDAAAADESAATTKALDTSTGTTGPASARPAPSGQPGADTVLDSEASGESAGNEGDATAIDKSATTNPEGNSARNVVDTNNRADRIEEASDVVESELSDGTITRDHRKNPTPSDPARFITTHPDISKVSSKVVSEVNRKVQPAVAACMKAHAKDPEKGARVQASILVTIANEQLSVTQTTLHVQGVVAEEALRTCLHAVFDSHVQAVPGAADAERHQMVFPVLSK